MSHLRFVTLVLITYLHGLRPSLITIVNQSHYRQIMCSHASIVGCIKKNVSVYNELVLSCHHENEESLVNQFLVNNEWIYIRRIKQNYQIHKKIVPNGKDSISTLDYKKLDDKNIRFLEMIFYPIILAKEGYVRTILAYYSTLKDNELLSLIYNYNKLNIINCDVYNLFNTDNSKCCLEYFTLLTFTKRLLCKNKFVPIIKKCLFHKYLTCEKKWNLNFSVLNDVIKKIVNAKEFRHFKHYPNTYIEDMLLHIVCTLGNQYKSTIQDDGYLDLSNIDLNNKELKSIYYNNQSEEKLIKSDQITFIKQLPYILNRASLELSIPPGSGHAVQRMCNVIYSPQITVINLAKNPNLTLDHILNLLDCFPNTEKIEIDPSVIINSTSFIKKISNVKYYFKYLHHLTNDRQVSLYNHEHKGFFLTPKKTLLIELSEKNEQAGKIIQSMYKIGHKYYVYIAVSRCTKKLIPFFLFLGFLIIYQQL